MKLLLINSVDNDRKIIDLSTYRKNQKALTFGEIINGHVRDKSRWYLHQLSGGKLVKLPETAKLAEYRYPKELFWIPQAVATSRPEQRPAEIDDEYRIEHQGAYAIGIYAGAIFGWVGLSFDLFRSRISSIFWISLIVASIVGFVISSLYGFQKYVVPSSVLFIPFLFILYSAFKATQSVWAIRGHLR